MLALRLVGEEDACRLSIFVSVFISSCSLSNRLITCKFKEFVLKEIPLAFYILNVALWYHTIFDYIIFNYTILAISILLDSLLRDHLNLLLRSNPVQFPLCCIPIDILSSPQGPQSPSPLPRY